VRLEFREQAFEDLQYWVQMNPKVAKRLLRLIEETKRDPFGGAGKPGPLRQLYHKAGNKNKSASSPAMLSLHFRYEVGDPPLMKTAASTGIVLNLWNEAVLRNAVGRVSDEAPENCECPNALS
jgi:hypothetical protein